VSKGEAALLATEKVSSRRIFYYKKRQKIRNEGGAVKIPYLPPLKVSHEAFPVSRKRLWLCRKPTRVLIGKSVAVTSGGMLHNAAVMGYNN